MYNNISIISESLYGDVMAMEGSVSYRDVPCDRPPVLDGTKLDYKLDYTPDYKLDYIPDYKLDYIPDYKLDYKPDYIPDYSNDT